MTGKDAYIIVDFGTGNLRVAVVSSKGELLGAARQDIAYHRDNNYDDAIYFKPDETWSLILQLCADALRQAGTVKITGISATSQREGIVVIDNRGVSVTGMPNIDHRGRKWEHIMTDKARIYQLAGRYPTSLFSALKVIGFQKVYTDVTIDKILSISDWVTYMFSGELHYEHSQASETLLYDVAQKQWAAELIDVFELDKNILPALTEAGTILGTVKGGIAQQLSISPEAKVIVGAADTQLAALSTDAEAGDVVIVSGTTTPIVKLMDTYVVDEHQRTWTGRHTEKGQFMFEANAGVTGLNYQRLKKIFYPNESYEVIEQELASVQNNHQCVAALGSLLADEKEPLLTGGFIFNVPVNHELSRADFVWATLWDIACSINENYNSLCSVTPNTKNYIWTCGGGMESKTLRAFIAALTGKEIRIRDNFRYASAVGGAILCNRALQNPEKIMAATEYVAPQKDRTDIPMHYDKWKQNRNILKQAY